MKNAIPLVLLGVAVLPAGAQSRAELSAGVGMAAVSASNGGGSQVGPAVDVALSMPVGGVRVGLEAALLAIGDEEPRTSDLRPRQTGTPPITDFDVVRRPRVLSTAFVMATVQVPVGSGAYIRPEIGAARHGFASYLVGATTVESAEVSHEWGPAAGMVAGYQLGGRSPAVSIEAGGFWSGGEDSSGDRTSFVLRIVPRIAL